MNTLDQPKKTVFTRLASLVTQPDRALAWRIRPFVIDSLKARSRKYLEKEIPLEFLSLRPKDAIAPDFCDLAFLYDTVRRRRPSVVFEFGSGCSTPVIASALKKNLETSGGTKPVFYSFEADAFWAQEAKKLLIAPLDQYGEIIHAPVHAETIDGSSVLVHGNIPPQIHPDFVYLDGPSGPADLQIERRIAADLLRMEPDFKPGFELVIDGRWENVAFLKKNFRRTYRFHHRWLYNNSFVELLA